jgi:hypothetical protein
VDEARKQRIQSAALDVYLALRAMMRIVRKDEHDMTLVERVVPTRFAEALVALVEAIERK